MGTTRCPVVTTLDISPYSTFSASVGTGTSAGRRRARPSAVESSRFVTGSGAVTFTGPAKSDVAQWTRAPATSSRWTHDIHWRPPATGPPSASLKNGSMRAIAPPSRESTTPVRVTTVRTPLSAARMASASHSRTTPASQSAPAGSSSLRRSSPRGP